MKNIFSLSKTSLLLIAGGLFFSACDTPQQAPDRPDLTIAFGSCNRTDLPQVMWGPLVANDPDVFIWLGDIVYGDTHDMQALRDLYDQVDREPGYQKLKETAKIIGIWDDHDYGWNDAGKYYSKRDSSKQVLMDFLGVDPSSDVWSHDGVYTSYTFGEHPTQTRVILLDTRYFRDTVVSDPDPNRRYTVNESGDILGEEQWAWLETEIKASDADIHIIGSGIQIVPQEHGWEKWGNFPKSRNRMLSLLREVKPKNTLLISGDRHIAEYSRIKLTDDYAVNEVTSSGLTHTWSYAQEEPNAYRIGDLIVKRNFGVIRIRPDKMTVEIRGEQDSLYNSMDIPLW